MGSIIFFGEMIGGFGLFMAWMYWEYRKTQKLVEQDRREAELLKQKAAAS